jgi:hypothetical protein
MRKLDLILENIRDEYMINLLEEGEVNELETLKTKKFLNENLNRVRAMLIEEGALDAVKGHLANNWGKYLGGAAALGAGAAGADALNDIGADARLSGAGEGDVLDNISSGAGIVADQAKEGLQQIGDKFIDQAGNILDQAGNVVGNISQSIQNTAGETMADMGAGDPRFQGQQNFNPEILSQQAQNLMK